jgi:hypothetical protein
MGGKVDQEAEFKAGGPQVVVQLGQVLVGKRVDGFDLQNNPVVAYAVWTIPM